MNSDGIAITNSTKRGRNTKQNKNMTKFTNTNTYECWWRKRKINWNYFNYDINCNFFLKKKPLSSLSLFLCHWPQNGIIKLYKFQIIFSGDDNIWNDRWKCVCTFDFFCGILSSQKHLKKINLFIASANETHHKWLSTLLFFRPKA